MDYSELPRQALVRLLEEHEAAMRDAGRNGIVMAYTGRTAPWQIIRKVKPKLNKIVKKLCAGDEKAQSQNEIWDGENLSTMVTLYKYRGQIDLIVTDPPTTRVRTSATTISGTKIQMIPNLENWFRRRMALAIANG